MATAIGDGTLIVELPDDFEATECDDGSVLASLPAEPAVELYLSVWTIDPEVKTESGLGHYCVSVFAEEHGAKLVHLDPERCFCRIDEERGRSKSKPMVSHWYVGYQNYGVVITVIVPHRLKDHPAATRVLAVIPHLMESIRKNDDCVSVAA